MTNITTNAKVRKNGPSLKKVLFFSLLVQVILAAVIWLAEPLRKTEKFFDPDAVEEMTEEAQKRNKERLKEEEAKRRRTELKKEDSEILKRREREKRERELTDKLEEMREIRDELRWQKEERLRVLSENTEERLLAVRESELLALCKKVTEAARILRDRSREPLAQSSVSSGDALYTATLAYVEGKETVGREELLAQASSIYVPIKERNSEIRKMVLSEGEHLQRYGLFVLDSNGLMERLIDYSDFLKEFHQFDDRIEEDYAFISEELAKNSDYSNEPDAQTLSLEEIFEAISQAEATIEKEFDLYRAGEIAELEKTSFKEALSRVSSAKSQMEAFGDSDTNAADRESGAASVPSLNKEIRTVADLQSYRSGLAERTEVANQQWARARNIASQAGSLARRSQYGRSGKSFWGQGDGRNRDGRSYGRGKSQIESDSKKTVGRGSKGSDLNSVDVNYTSRRPEKLLTKISLNEIKAKALPGRRFSEESNRSGWLYLDSWYIIGPWENKGVLDYTRTRPPEISIDLDAQYSDGKINSNTGKPRLLRWEFLQSDMMRLVPPVEEGDSTYYGFTEVYFEEATEMLLAIASDDAARMWVNDKLIWEDRGQSGWNLSEGFKKVVFRKGFNKFLVRIENGPKLCEFSVLLCPPEQVANSN